jgi:hypothetical protein
VGASTVFSPSGLLENMLLPFPVGQVYDIHHTTDHSGMDVELSVSGAAQEDEGGDDSGAETVPMK